MSALRRRRAARSSSRTAIALSLLAIVSPGAGLRCVAASLPSMSLLGLHSKMFTMRVPVSGTEGLSSRILSVTVGKISSRSNDVSNVRDARERLQDIFDVIAHIERYATRGREAFEADQLLQSWFVRHLQIIGEAVACCRKKSAPEIRLSQITGYWPAAKWGPEFPILSSRYYRVEFRSKLEAFCRARRICLRSIHP